MGNISKEENKKMTTLRQILKLFNYYQECKVIMYESKTDSMIPFTGGKDANDILRLWDDDVVIDWPVENVYPKYERLEDGEFKIVMAIVIMKPYEYERTHRKED